MSYIVKNCPAFDDQARCTMGHIITGNYLRECESVENCVIKQIVNKCKRTGYFAAMGGNELLKTGILNLLEIEEVDE